MWSPEYRNAVLLSLSGRNLPARPSGSLVRVTPLSKEEITEVEALKTAAPFVFLPTLTAAPAAGHAGDVLPLGCELDDRYSYHTRFFPGEVGRELAPGPVSGSHSAWRHLGDGRVLVEAASPAQSSLLLTASNSSVRLWSAEEVLRTVTPAPALTWSLPRPATMIKMISTRGDFVVGCDEKLLLMDVETGLRETIATRRRYKSQ